MIQFTGMLLLLLTGCSTVSQKETATPGTSPTEPAACPEILRDGRRWEPVDEREIDGARKGCVTIFGPGACVIRITKQRDHVFHVTCRRGK